MHVEIFLMHENKAKNSVLQKQYYMGENRAHCSGELLWEHGTVEFAVCPYIICFPLQKMMKWSFFWRGGPCLKCYKN